MFAEEARLVVVTQDELIQARVLQCFAPSLHDKVWHVENDKFWNIRHISNIIYTGLRWGQRYLAFVKNIGDASSRARASARVLFDYVSLGPGPPSYNWLMLTTARPILLTMSPEDLYDSTNKKLYTWVDGEGYRVK